MIIRDGAHYPLETSFVLHLYHLWPELNSSVSRCFDFPPLNLSITKKLRFDHHQLSRLASGTNCKFILFVIVATQLTYSKVILCLFLALVFVEVGVTKAEVASLMATADLVTVVVVLKNKPGNGVQASDQHQYVEKNILGRVYDALNVLMAMDIIFKDKKEIHGRVYLNQALIIEEDYEEYGNLIVSSSTLADTIKSRTDMLKKTKTAVSSKPIVMRVEYAHCPNLTIIDTLAFVLKEKGNSDVAIRYYLVAIHVSV
ncbi:hypothetical protein L1987_02763 [Smallanthus sonchifolius]|uniref:Uncharacterized protein n=1 Tax=Smallanthus sonchifolius TaxID=185202 RepID=A0ACB9K8W7_9ASTR|nr:hypothetical protein L1987_02763 [Smallanthus sonchifolius]